MVSLSLYGVLSHSGVSLETPLSQNAFKVEGLWAIRYFIGHGMEGARHLSLASAIFAIRFDWMEGAKHLSLASGVFEIRLDCFTVAFHAATRPQ